MWNTRITAFKKQRLMSSAVMLVGIVPNWFSLDAIYSQRIVYERFNPCKQTVIHSGFQYGNKEWGNPREAVCFWGFQCLCVNTERINQRCGQVVGVGWGGDTLSHAHSHSHCCQHLFCLHVWKDSSGPLSHFKHSCGRWRCLERTFLSHSGVCSSIKKQTQTWK